MRKLSYLFVVFIVLTAHYASATIRTLNNNIPSPGQYMTWNSVQAACSPGDTIYMSGSPYNYGNIDVTINNLTLIGSGYNPDKQNSLATEVVDINLQANTIDVEGIKMRYFITDPGITGLTQAFIRYCSIKKAWLRNTVLASGIFDFRYNVIGDYTSPYAIETEYSGSNVSTIKCVFFNNLILNTIYYHNNASSLTQEIWATSNTFISYSNVSATIGDINIQFARNILYNYAELNAGVFSSFNCAYNCIYSPSYPSFTFLPNDGGTTITGDPLFVNPCIPCVLNFGGDYNLQPGSPCRDIFGVNTTDIGVTGGTSNTIGMPDYTMYNQRGEIQYLPLINSFNVPVSGSYGTPFTANIYTYTGYSYPYFVSFPGIVQGEYFWNKDPGIGNGIPITITSPSSSFTLNATIQTTGAHQLNNILYVRFRSEAGWSLAEGRPYFIFPAIKAGEYFWDTDPGVGNGTSLGTFAVDDSINISKNISTAGLKSGYHTLYTRTLDVDNVWSVGEGRQIYLQPKITSAEYFWDTDPGISNGTPTFSFVANDTVNIIPSIPTAGLKKGYHTFYIRTKDMDGRWSLSEGRSINISTQITAAEYFWNTDPGLGNGTAMNSFTVSDSINITRSIGSTGLKKGYHTFYTRTKDADGKWSLSEGRTIYVTPLITAAEYFWNTDPGIGNGTAMNSFAASDSVNITRAIATAVLTKGYNTLYIRTKDNFGNWSLSEPRSIYVQTQITSAEYFWNTDPGQGNGASLGSFTASDSISINSIIATSSLNDGYNTLYTRTKDKHGNWSISEARTIYIKPQILGGEAFWETDPGFSNGFPLITGLPSDSINATYTNSSTLMSRGLHFLYYRFQTTKHIWGLTERRNIYVYKPLVAAEYYFDNDPGKGNGTAFTVTAGTTINYTGNISLPTLLATGQHKIYIRTMDSDGVWSLPEAHIFFIAPLVANQIVAGEYFFDNDPGVGNGSSLTIGTPAATAGGAASISIPSLTAGTHTVFIRTKDNRGVWSLQEGKSFSVANIATKIIAGEFYFDNDPGVGNATPLIIPAQAATVNVFSGILIPTLTPGLHKVFVRTKDDLNQWSHPEGRLFYVPSTQANATQVKAAEFFVDNDPGIGNASAVAIPVPASTVNVCMDIALPVFSTGTHKLFVRTKDNNNVWSLQEPRIFEGIASPDVNISPGPVASICGGGSVTLTANTNGGFNTYQWYNGCTLISGATNATYTTNITGTYMVLVTNGGNSQTAYVQVAISPNPTVFIVSGGGNYCSVSGTGVSVLLSGSELSTSYQLVLNGNINIGSPIAGTGSALTFNNVTAPGLYTVRATNAASCELVMALNATVSVTTATHWYRDSDNDGFGDAAVDSLSCQQPTGFVTDNTDCNDNVASIHPGAIEILCNGIDENCNGMADDIGVFSTAPTSATTDAYNNNICSGNSVILSQVGGILGTGASYKWYSGSCGGTLVGTGATINLSPAATTTYYVRAEGACNTTTCASVTVTVNTAPVTSLAIMPFTGMPGNVCSGTVATISIAPVANATFYVWDAPSGSYFNNNPLNVSPYTTATPSVTVTFGSPSGSLYNVGIQAGNACGSSIRQSQKVRGLTSVPTSISGALTACASSTGSYSTPAVAGATSYLWTITGNATVSGTGTTATVTFNAGWTGGTLCVAAQTTCYTSPTKCISISNTAAALGAISGTFTACPNSVITYSVPASAGAASYTWTLPPGATGSSTTNSINISFGPGYNAVGSICVSVTSVCGVTSAVKCKTVAPGLPSQPNSIAGSTNGLCGQSVVYTCPSQGAGVTYTWTVPSGATIVSGQGTTSINVQFGTFTTGSVCVTANNTCGSSISRCIAVKGAPATPGAITAIPGSWCTNTSGVEFDVNVANITGSYTLSWTYPVLPVATYVLGGGNSTSLLMDWGTGSGNINVTASNACGSGTKTSTWSSTCRQGEVGTVSTLMVSPNPTTGMVNISYTAVKGNTVINVSDLSGRVVMTQTASSVDGVNNMQLDMGKLAKGAYMLSVQSTQGNKQVKVVVE